MDEFFYMLFTEDDWIEIHGRDALTFMPGDVPIEDAQVVGFQVSARVLRDRLDLVGVSLAVVAAQLQRLVESEAEILEGLRDIFSDSDDFTEYEREIEYLRQITWDSWLTQLRLGIVRGDSVDRFGRRESLGTASHLMAVWEDFDPRYPLRAVLETLPDDALITLDLADLIEGGWLEPSIDPQTVGRRVALDSSEGLLPPVVLAEGRFDIEVLNAALRLRRPHLMKFIRFPDFSHKNEGGASALRQTLRAFVAAGIPNRVVALFDNDAAARDVLRSVDEDSLPPNIRVTCLPDLDTATNYPTIGPHGQQPMDINGLASSIELFLGTDALTVNESLVPVQWTGYVRSLGAYQGELLDKGSVQRNFRQKVTVATNDPHSMATQDWSALDLLLDHLLELIAQTLTPPSDSGSE